MDSHSKQALHIILSIPYLTIASLSRDRKPWITPVFAAYDSEYNFYWISAKDALHSQYVRANNEVAIVIFDPRVTEGTGQGVYMEALVYELEDENKIAEAIPVWFDRAGRPHRHMFDFVDNGPVRIYKAVPHKVWLSTTEQNGSHEVDVRIEISLKNE